METNKAKEMAGKWIAETNTAMMSVYEKQIENTCGFYNSLYKSFSAQRNGNEHGNFSPFSYNGFNAYKAMSPVFGMMNMSGNFMNPSSYMDGLFRQMREFNNQYYTALKDNFKDKQTEWKELNKKSRESIEEECKAASESMNSVLEKYYENLNNSIVSNRKIFGL